jgi:hypothetical protein
VVVSSCASPAAQRQAGPDSPPEAAFAGRGPIAGAVRVEGGRLVDDAGPVWALGATYMSAAWFYRHDRPALERNLATLSAAGFDYIRVLGAVGGAHWAGRETDPRWPDYERVVAGLTDLAHERFGLRTVWTVFGDTELLPSPAARRDLIGRVADVVASRSRAVMHLEVANESYQNGFGGDDGRRELGVLTTELVRRLRVRGVTLPVASSAPRSASCDDLRDAAAGSSADLLTAHFTRTLAGPLGPWGPVLAPLASRACRGVDRPVSNNEPIGPGSSVEREDDPARLVAAAAVTLVAGLPLHVFHSRAGVRGDVAFADLPNAAVTLAAFRALREGLPREVATGETIGLGDARHPFDTPAPPSDGGGRVLGAPAALLPDGAVVVVAATGPLVTMRVRRPMLVRVLDVARGTWSAPRTLGPRDTLRLAASEVVVRAVWREGRPQ